jgi:hypothetical protein
MVDPDAGVAHWFDFETVHHDGRSVDWRRADDLRALLTTCLQRTDTVHYGDVLRLILDAYDDEGVTRILASSFTSVWQRPLTFHLAQAPLSLENFRQIHHLLRDFTA